MIEIHSPEVEALIRQRMSNGKFNNPEDVIVEALKLHPVAPPPAVKPRATLRGFSVQGPRYRFRERPRRRPRRCSPQHQSISSFVSAFLLDTNIPSELTRSDLAGRDPQGHYGSTAKQTPRRFAGLARRNTADCGELGPSIGGMQVARKTGQGCRRSNRGDRPSP